METENYHHDDASHGNVPDKVARLIIITATTDHQAQTTTNNDQIQIREGGREREGNMLGKKDEARYEVGGKGKGMVEGEEKGEPSSSTQHTHTHIP